MEKSSETENSYEEKCRICMLNYNEMTTVQVLNNSFDMQCLLIFLGIEVAENKPLLNLICKNCSCRLDEILNLKKQCEISYNILSQISDIRTENNNPPLKYENNESETEINKDETFNTIFETDIDNNSLKSFNSDISQNDDKESNETIKKFSDVETIGENNSLNCKVCNKSVANKRSLRRHQLLHQNNKPTYFCSHCKKFYSTSSNLSYHYKKFHSVNKLTRTACKLCSKSVWNIGEHMKFTHGDIKLQCSFCEKKFKSRHGLRVHFENCHENVENNFKSLCSICGKAFRTNGDLSSHLQTKHNDKRNFSCKYCEKKFKTRSHLTSHEKVSHLNYRPYECEICSKSFASKQILLNHVRTHTGERPFVCTICSKAFGHTSSLRNHIKLVHGSKI
ncbi:zinc finger protein 98-like [Chrysoperla carnea]|uniref:zinc finger protein 98-like n=1 Tax=Chrysoperla carnea TaxID=189513 RepID=UPI001D07DA29|nr:zinc finger protein 98-like [Chrysoperla carnea]